MAGVEQYRPRARYSVHHGADRFTRSRKPSGKLRQQDGGGRHTQMAGRGFHPRVAGSDPNVARGEGESRTALEKSRLVIPSRKIEMLLAVRAYAKQSFRLSRLSPLTASTADAPPPAAHSSSLQQRCVKHPLLTTSRDWRSS